MSHHHRKPDELDDFVKDAEARRRNVVFPDTVRNGRSVDAFFWRGSPNPPLVQRIAAWMFGLAFIVAGICLFDAAVVVRDKDHSWVGFSVVTGIGLFAVFV